MTVQKQRITGPVLVFLISLLLFLTIYGSVAAARPSVSCSRSPQKYYISIEVQYGDTLGSIADTYNSGTSCSREAYIRELMRMNHLTDDQIFAGTWLMIPCYEK